MNNNRIFIIKDNRPPENENEKEMDLNAKKDLISENTNLRPVSQNVKPLKHIETNLERIKELMNEFDEDNDDERREMKSIIPPEKEIELSSATTQICIFILVIILAIILLILFIVTELHYLIEIPLLIFIVAIIIKKGSFITIETGEAMV